MAKGQTPFHHVNSFDRKCRDLKISYNIQSYNASIMRKLKKIKLPEKHEHLRCDSLLRGYKCHIQKLEWHLDISQGPVQCIWLV